MFGWHPRLAIDAFLGVTSDSPVKDHITYVSSLEKRLKFAYKTAAKVAEKEPVRYLEGDKEWYWIFFYLPT
jgi:hypothetical protein